jgi:hypothetical protein
MIIAGTPFYLCALLQAGKPVLRALGAPILEQIPGVY